MSELARVADELAGAVRRTAGGTAPSGSPFTPASVVEGVQERIAALGGVAAAAAASGGAAELTNAAGAFRFMTGRSRTGGADVTG